MQKRLLHLTFPEKEKETKEAEKGMEKMFNKLFRGNDGKPKPIVMNVGEALGKDFETKDYLKSIRDKKS